MSETAPIPPDILEKCQQWAAEGNYGSIFREYPDLAERIMILIRGRYGRPSFALAKNIDAPWYQTSDHHEYWNNYHKLLEQKGEGWDEGRNTIDTSTNKILNLLFDPKLESTNDNTDFQKYGLVVGYVQSGKTANYTGLISKAADSGYDLIIVFAGTNNDLRKQTQRRLDRELTGYIQDSAGNSVSVPNKEWIRITEDDEIDTPGSGDFGGVKKAGIYSNIPGIDIFDEGRPIIAVMKKWSTRLICLKDWLSKIEPEKRDKINLLMIDDESDSASADVSTNTGRDLPEEYVRASETNRHIREILGLFPRRAYVGYTATPYASVLTSPASTSPTLGPTLYPRDFIVSLPPSTGYYGVAEFFSAEGVMNRHVRVPIPCDHEEISEPEIPPNWTSVNDLSSDLPNSLKESIHVFFLAAAARNCRGQQNSPNTMVIHNSMNNDPQEFIWKRVQNYSREMKTHFFDDFSDEGEKLRRDLENLWVDDFLQNDKTTENWEEIYNSLEEVLDSFEPRNDVYLVNSDQDDEEITVLPTQRQLDYTNYSNGGSIIAIGGNILSRGLTLEGLCVSYFVRETQIYDSLTQMGRWFGFRPGYADLVRLYLTPNLLEWFSWLVNVEADLRADIERYDIEDKSPLELAVRVLKHVRSAPGEAQLSPTRQLAMQDAVEWSGGLDGMTPMTKNFHLEDVTVLKRNLENASDFFAYLTNEYGEAIRLEQGAAGSYLWESIIDYRVIINFLQHQEFPESGSWKLIEIIPYIESRVEENEGREWSVCFVNNNKATPEHIYGTNNQDNGLSIGTSVRSRLVGKESIEELTTSAHIGIDLEGYPADYTGLEGRSKAKSDRNPQHPLLLIYILNKDSEPLKGRRYKRPVQGLFNGFRNKEHVVGLCTVFPYSESAEEDEFRTYYHARGVDPVLS